jgi:hypothetical protein
MLGPQYHRRPPDEVGRTIAVFQLVEGVEDEGDHAVFVGDNQAVTAFETFLREKKPLQFLALIRRQALATSNGIHHCRIARHTLENRA